MTMPKDPAPQPADVIGMKQNIGNMRTAVETLHCVPQPIGCGREVTLLEIARWDALTQKEYTQSGWCKECQDKIFKEPEDIEECIHPGRTCNEFQDAFNGGVYIVGEDCLCSCADPCCEADIGVGVIDCGSQHCRVHGGN